MPRAKPRSVQSASFSVPQPIPWTQIDRESLLEDVGLDIRTYKNKCAALLSELGAELADYNFWMQHAQSWPSPAERLAELKKALKVLEPAFAMLTTLSPAALNEIKNAGIAWNEEAIPRLLNLTIGPARPVEKHDFIQARDVNRQAQELLIALIIRMKRATARLRTEERRGRKPSSLPALITRMREIFSKFYRGAKADRQESEKNFIMTAVKPYTTIPRRRLSSLLAKQ